MTKLSAGEIFERMKKDREDLSAEASSPKIECSLYLQIQALIESAQDADGITLPIVVEHYRSAGEKVRAEGQVFYDQDNVIMSWSTVTQIFTISRIADVASVRSGQGDGGSYEAGMGDDRWE